MPAGRWLQLPLQPLAAGGAPVLLSLGHGGQLAPNANNASYLVAFRGNASFDAGLGSDALDRVQVHRWAAAVKQYSALCSSLWYCIGVCSTL